MALFHKLELGHDKLEHVLLVCVRLGLHMVLVCELGLGGKLELVCKLGQVCILELDYMGLVYELECEQGHEQQHYIFLQRKDYVRLAERHEVG